MKKNDKIHLNISSEDKKELKRRAALCRMTLNTYCIYLLMSMKPVIPKEE
jgi:hypothetical protein